MSNEDAHVREGDTVPVDVQPRGYPDEAPPTYRDATPEECRAANPQTPRALDHRVRITCPDGIVLNTEIAYENGEPLKNVLRAVISLESPNCRGPVGEQPDGKAYVFVSYFENEIGQVLYGYAEALVGGDHPN